MCAKFHCLMYQYDSYGLQRVIIAYDNFTNMPGCHGNCSGGLCMCMESTMVKGTGIMQIQAKGEAIFTGY